MSGGTNVINLSKRPYLFRDGKHALHACGSPVFILVAFQVFQDLTDELRVVYLSIPHRSSDVQRRVTLGALFGHWRADMRLE